MKKALQMGALLALSIANPALAENQDTKAESARISRERALAVLMEMETNCPAQLQEKMEYRNSLSLVLSFSPDGDYCIADIAEKRGCSINDGYNESDTASFNLSCEPPLFTS